MRRLRRHITYAVFLARHKWFVLRAGRRLGVPLWRLIIHDWSRLVPSEWPHYVTKHARDCEGIPSIDDPVRRAVLRHHQRNAHHWQHWIAVGNDGAVTALVMPDAIVREMVADWIGAERCRVGGWDIRPWYAENQHRMTLHADTRRLVEALVGDIS